MNTLLETLQLKVVEPLLPPLRTVLFVFDIQSLNVLKVYGDTDVVLGVSKAEIERPRFLSNFRDLDFSSLGRTLATTPQEQWQEASWLIRWSKHAERGTGQTVVEIWLTFSILMVFKDGTALASFRDSQYEVSTTYLYAQKRPELANETNTLKANIYLQNIEESLQKPPYDEPFQISLDKLKCCCSGRELFSCYFCTGRKSPMCLGEGSFAMVYRAQWLGSSVAVKRYAHKEDFFSMTNDREKFITHARHSFFQELNVLKRLRHPNMIRFFGADERNLTLVMEIAEHGCLTDFIKANSTREFTNTVWPIHLRIAADIAAGLFYLHLQNIIHGDIKSLNILLSASNVPKISDFGSAEDKNLVYVNQLRTPLSYAWSSPERLKGAPISKESDIFGLAVIFWELTTCRLPYDNSHFTGSIAELKHKIINDNFRPQMDKEVGSLLRGYRVPNLMISLFMACWDAAPFKRPNAEQVCDILSRVKAFWKCPQCGWNNEPERVECDNCMHNRKIPGIGAEIFMSGDISQPQNITKELPDADDRNKTEVSDINEDQVFCPLCEHLNDKEACECESCGGLLYCDEDEIGTQNAPDQDLDIKREKKMHLTIHSGHSTMSRGKDSDVCEGTDTWICDLCGGSNMVDSLECIECFAVRNDIANLGQSPIKALLANYMSKTS